MQLEDLFAERARTASAAFWGPEPQDETISLAYGLADPRHFPREELLEAAAAAMAEGGGRTLNYGPVSARLIGQITERLRRQGVKAHEEQIVLGYGSGEILHVLPQVLVEPGDPVIVEAPTFLGAVNRFRSSGARLIGVPVGAQGMDPAALEERLRELRKNGQRAKFVYTIPTFHNPNGSTMPLAQRERLAALAAEYGTLLVEDDAYGELRFRGADLPPLAALNDDWVLRVSTYSKILAPGLRLGYAHGPLPLIQRLAAFKTSGGGGPFLTATVANYSENGRLEAHIGELRALYGRKCTVMIETIRREFPAEVRFIEPDGGFFIWCTLPPGLSANALAERVATYNAEILAGPRCFADGSGDDSFRLAFSYQSEERLSEGIARVGRAIRELMGKDLVISV